MSEQPRGAHARQALGQAAPGADAVRVDPLAAAALAEEELRSSDDAHESLARVTEALARELGGSTVGVLLEDDDGLRVAAASSDSLSALLCVDAACGDGPARMAYRTGRAVACHRLPTPRYGQFSRAASAAGFSSAYGVPVSTGPGRPPLGALLLASDRPRALDRAALASLEGLAASIALALSGERPSGHDELWDHPQQISGHESRRTGKDQERSATDRDEKDALA